MTDVTFSPEQVKEIRRRVHALPVRYMLDTSAVGATFTYPSVRVDALLAAFPLPKVKRFRTFKWVSEYRVNGDVVEAAAGDVWQTAGAGHSRTAFAARLIEAKAWSTLKEFADVCANPTEEVDP